MKTKTLNLLLCLIAVTSSVLISCSEDLGFGTNANNQEAKNELLKTAKEIVQQQNGNVPLPVNGTGSSQSRSAMSVITSGTPLWDYVKYYNIDGMQVLMIELQTAEQVFSRITSTKDGITSTKEVDTFSRLVIRKKGTKLYTHVITYMPESEYAMANQAKLDTIGYYPQYVDFTGGITQSDINGNISNVLFYKEGNLITKASLASGTKKCCNQEKEQNIIILNFFSNLNLSRSIKSLSVSNGDGNICKECNIDGCICNEGDDCNCILLQIYFCGKCQQDNCNCLKFNGDECRCEFSESNKYCDTCHQPIDWCLCPKDCSKCGSYPCECPDEICEKCLMFPCQCDTPEPNNPCDKCGNDPCICHLIDNTPIDTCDICKQEPCICCKVCNTHPCVCPCEDCGELLKNCICETNTTPISYDPHDNDRLVGLIDECVEPTTCCSMAVLEMAYLIYGGTEMNQGSFAQYYTQFNYMSPEEETVLNYNDSFITHFFETSSLYTMVSAINSGNVVVVRKNGHYMLVFGLQYDGDVIYADPHEGGIYAVNESYFSGCDAFGIGGINQSRMRMLAQ